MKPEEISQIREIFREELEKVLQPRQRFYSVDKLREITGLGKSKLHELIERGILPAAPWGENGNGRLQVDIEDVVTMHRRAIKARQKKK